MSVQRTGDTQHRNIQRGQQVAAFEADDRGHGGAEGLLPHLAYGADHQFDGWALRAAGHHGTQHDRCVVGNCFARIEWRHAFAYEPLLPFAVRFAE